MARLLRSNIGVGYKEYLYDRLSEGVEGHERGVMCLRAWGCFSC